jgi:hypothetical protein
MQPARIASSGLQSARASGDETNNGNNKHYCDNPEYRHTASIHFVLPTGKRAPSKGGNHIF